MSYPMIVMYVILLSAITGLAAKFIVGRIQCPFEITWKEYWIVMTTLSLLVAPGSVKLGWELAKKNKMTYNEFRNGWEASAVTRPIKCERDGSCVHDYDCDPYIVMVPYSCNCDNKGSCDTCYRPETRYHSCPYVDVETDYVINTTVGEYVIAENRFPDDPQKHRWRKYESIPEYEIQNAGVGAHPFWLTVKDRLERKEPGPVTKHTEYENYIYASDKTILKQYSGEIQKFQTAGLLPAICSSVFNFYDVNKVYFVGFSTKDAKDWQRSLNYFNAAAGMQLEGDMHLVIIKNDLISSNPDEYAIALKAHWQNTAQFGKNSLSKNAFAVLVGTADGQTVSWSRAFTGMPMGNEELVTAIMSKVKGSELRPEILIGDVRNGIAKKTEKQKGVLEDIVFGLSEKSTRFKRVSMAAKDGRDNGSGFLYLMSEIRPTLKHLRIILISTFAFCCLGWVAVFFIGERAYRRKY